MKRARFIKLKKSRKMTLFSFLSYRIKRGRGFSYYAIPPIKMKFEEMYEKWDDLNKMLDEFKEWVKNAYDVQIEEDEWLTDKHEIKMRGHEIRLLNHKDTINPRRWKMDWREPTECPVCNKTFKRKVHTQVYCSEECRRIHADRTYNSKEIRKLNHVGRQWVNRFATKRGAKWTKEETIEAMKLKLKGLSTSEVAYELGRTYASVYERLKVIKSRSPMFYEEVLEKASTLLAKESQ